MSEHGGLGGPETLVLPSERQVADDLGLGEEVTAAELLLVVLEPT